MSYDEFHSQILTIISKQRIREGERYIAGGVALNVLLDGTRRSEDIDIFHSSEEAVEASYNLDLSTLTGEGYSVTQIRYRPGFIEALVEGHAGKIILQWVRDSAFRFFPLVEDVRLGLTLHPLDLATNKMLALVGRTEIRDYVDTILCHQQLQHLAFLVWASVGKDPGFSPDLILNEITRASRYTQDELDILAFASDRPNAMILSTMWRQAMIEARQIIDLLNVDTIGCCVLNFDMQPIKGSLDEMKAAISSNSLLYHRGTIGGCWPRAKSHS